MGFSFAHNQIDLYSIILAIATFCSFSVLTTLPTFHLQFLHYSLLLVLCHIYLILVNFMINFEPSVI